MYSGTSRLMGEFTHIYKHKEKLRLVKLHFVLSRGEGKKIKATYLSVEETIQNCHHKALKGINKPHIELVWMGWTTKKRHSRTKL